MAVSWIRPGSGVAEAPDSRTTRRRWARLAMLALLSATVAVAAQYDDDLFQAVEHGADTGFQIYDGAGTELADRAAAQMERRPPPPS